MVKMDALSSKMNAREIYEHVPEDWEESKTFTKVSSAFEHYALMHLMAEKQILEWREIALGRSS